MSGTETFVALRPSQVSRQISHRSLSRTKSREQRAET